MAVSAAELPIFRRFDRRPIVTPSISSKLPVAQMLTSISTGVKVGRRFTDRNLARLRNERQVLDDVAPIERNGEEKPQRRNRTVDGRRADLVRSEMQLEKPQLFSSRRVGRSAEKLCQLRNGANVVVLGLRRKIANRHVFDHAPSQRADALIGHGILLSEPRLLTP